MRVPQIVKVEGSQYKHLRQPRQGSIETICLMEYSNEKADPNAPLCPFCDRDMREQIR